MKTDRVSGIRQALFATYEIGDHTVVALLIEFAAIAFLVGYKTSSKTSSWLAGILALSVLVFLNRYKFIRFAFSILAVVFWTFFGFGIGGLDGSAISIFCAVIAFGFSFLFHWEGIIINTKPTNNITYNSNDKSPYDASCWSTDSEGNTIYVGSWWQDNNTASKGK